MSGPRWDTVRSILDGALQLDGEERERFVQEKCGDDAGLQQEVRQLLDEDERPDSLLDEPPGIEIAEVELASLKVGLEEGRRVGPYEIQRTLASGGMGKVYLAERVDEHFHKRVALKVIKPGMDSEEILRRFRNERQVLAQLEHPNIARLLDGGVTEEQRPYLVMEYVEGLPIDRYCEENRLDVRSRLQLVGKVCCAVHAAHQSLVIHRDLKPGNILVTDAGEPKLLDFGIAKVLNPDPESQQSETLEHQRVMTPEYASPEQVLGGPVTTSSDVYSLGVVLYELLTGSRPLQIRDLARAEVERIVGEVEPNRPSEAVTTRVDGQDERSEPGTTRALAAALRGDLDNIVLRALHKDPARRYSSVDQLAQDLAHHLEGRPVIARPDTWTYRTSKFVRRNRMLVGAVTAVVLALVAGLITTRDQYLRADEATGLAESRLTKVQELAANLDVESKVAQRRFEDVRGLARSFLFDLDDLLEDVAGATPAREFIVRKGHEYLERLTVDAGDNPDLLAEVAKGYLAIGDLQGGAGVANLGRPDDALASYQTARMMVEDLFATGPSNPRDQVLLAECYYRVGTLLQETDTLDEAMVSYRLALDLCRELEGTSFPRDSLFATMTGVLDSLIMRSWLAGEQDQAIPYAEESLALQLRLLRTRPGDRALQREVEVARCRLGTAQYLAGQGEIAEENITAAITRLRELHEANPDDATTSRALSFGLNGTIRQLAEESRHEEGLELAEESLVLSRELADADPSNLQAQRDVGVSLNLLAQLYQSMKEHESALDVSFEYLDLTRDIAEFAPSNTNFQRDLGVSLAYLTRSLVTNDRPEEALKHCEEALQVFQGILQSDAGNVEVRRDVAALYWDFGKVHRKLAAQAQNEAQKLQSLERARDEFQRHLDAMRQLQGQGQLAGVDVRHIVQNEQDLRRTEADIAALRGSADDL